SARNWKRAPSLPKNQGILKLLPRLMSTSFKPGPRNVFRPRLPPLAHPIHAPDASCSTHGGRGKSADVMNPLRKSDRLAVLDGPNAGALGASGPAPSPLIS